MNNERRKRIRQLIKQLGPASSIIDEVRTMLEEIQEEEREYLDAMPSSLQDGERYAKGEAAVDALENALETLGDLSFDDLTSHMEEACA